MSEGCVGECPTTHRPGGERVRRLIRRRIEAAFRGGVGASGEVQWAVEGGLLPGVVLVPAMLIAFTNMEEKGVSYVYAG